MIELQPAYSETAYRVSLWGDEVESISHFDPLSGEVYGRQDELVIYPATHYVTSPPTVERALEEIRRELDESSRTSTTPTSCSSPTASASAPSTTSR